MMRACRFLKGLTRAACGTLLLSTLLCLPAEAQLFGREVPLITRIEAVDLRHAGAVAVGIVVLVLVLALLRGLVRLLLILMVAGALVGGFLWLWETDGDAEAAGIVERLRALVVRDEDGNP